MENQVSDALSHLDRDGYVIIENAISAQDADRVSDELEPWFKATPRCVGDFYGWSTTRLAGLLVKAPSTRELALHSLMLAIAKAVLNPHCDVVQLNLMQGVRIHPGERLQPPHRDEEMWPGPKGERQFLINVIWALDDFTEENGATRLWRSSHREELDRDADPTVSIPAVMSRGSALVFLGSLTHSAGANQSTEHRTGIITSYCLGWLRQYENAYLSYPPEVARTFDPELQALLGYRIHRPNLGGWEGAGSDAIARGRLRTSAPCGRVARGNFCAPGCAQPVQHLTLTDRGEGQLLQLGFDVSGVNL